MSQLEYEDYEYKLVKKKNEFVLMRRKKKVELKAKRGIRMKAVIWIRTIMIKYLPKKRVVIQ